MYGTSPIVLLLFRCYNITILVSLVRGLRRVQRVPIRKALDRSAKSKLNTEVLANWRARLKSLISEVINALSEDSCQRFDEIRLFITLAVRNTNTCTIY
jgi:hypothetical protein